MSEKKVASQPKEVSALDVLFGSELYPFANKDELVNNVIPFFVRELSERDSANFGTKEWALVIEPQTLTDDEAPRDDELLTMTQTPGPRQEKMEGLRAWLEEHPGQTAGPFILKAIAVKKGTLHYLYLLPRRT